MPIAIPVVGAGAVLFILGMIVVGIVLSYFIVPPLVGLLRQIPFVGGQLAAQVQDAVQQAENVAANWWHSNVDPLVAYIFAPVNAFTDFLGVTLNWAGSVTQALLALAQAAGGNAGNIVGQLAQIISKIASLANLIAIAQTAIGNVADALHTALTVTIPGAIGAAASALQTAFHVGLTAEAALRVAAVNALQQLIAQAVAGAEALAAQGLLDLSHQLLHTATALASAIVTAEAQGKAYTDGVAHQLGIEITDISTLVIPAAIAIPMAAIKTVADELTQTTEQCINPTCSALSAGLDLFALLQQAAELLLIVDLILYATQHPDQAAHDLTNGIDDLVGLARPVLAAMGIRV